MEPLMDIPTTQRYLGDLSRSKVEDLIKTDRITAVKVGTVVRVVTASVDAYVTRLIEEGRPESPWV